MSEMHVSEIHTVFMECMPYKMPHPKHAGVEGTEEMLEWLWDMGVSAVAGDPIGFEVHPQKSYKRDDGAEVPGVFLHEYVWAGWGMPVR
jgi:hypothetical protein